MAATRELTRLIETAAPHWAAEVCARVYDDELGHMLKDIAGIEARPNGSPLDYGRAKLAA